MKNFLGISEAGVLGLHAMSVLAFKEGQWRSVRKLALTLKVSPHHLSQVLQGLRRQGLLKSVMGPRGGYLLAKDSHRISLLEIYEATEGKFSPDDCVMERRVCAGKKCLPGNFLKVASDQFREYLAKAKLSDLKDLYQPGDRMRK